MPTIRIECQDCHGTGLHVGFAERDGLAVVCQECRGTGSRDLNYTPFTGRRPREEITRVIGMNPGVILNPEIVGDAGVSYEEFNADPTGPFRPGAELREYTCPRWFHRAASPHRVQWEECKDGIGVPFEQCPHFPDKAACWERFDRENTG